ncbi:MAG: alanine--tRNA ligase [Cyclobacteriaceae bacterium]|nr:alanine--tRNA ligase [Cyclobacteriaceae bacterium]
MDSASIRRKFLDFFENKGHKIVPSAPLVLKNDPTLLFTNSGMVQFKDYFLGNSIPQHKRIADTQKCLRVSGKHNDLEDVGLDTYHHTMFEMLGNWSFGDYFKKEAIAWAWELLTEEYKLPKERLYVTVFGGDKNDNLPVDEEAKELWKQFVSEDRIIHGIKKDNFWEMGEQGPCGPCSEIHIDLRPEAEVKQKPGKELVNSDHPQVVEIWNLVFIQFNRLASGALEPLPDKHVDTGMGFERLCMAIQGKTSNYDTDVFRPLMDFIAKEAGIVYTATTPSPVERGQGGEVKTDIAIRVIADHIRAVAFTIADGQLPSNTGAGYVIRRILRRAVRYGFSYLNFKEPFFHKLVPVLANQFKDVFPELQQQLDYVTRVVLEEEVSFLRTLGKGIILIEGIIKFAQDGDEESLNNEAALDFINSGGAEILGADRDGKPTMIMGEVCFTLYDRYGFPLDLTELIARENGFSIDRKGFDSEMAKQKSRSKADATKETGDWILVGDDVKTEFIGYEHLSAEAKIVKYRKVKQKNKELFQIVLDKTPFYAESGGQVGDTGVLETANEKILVTDTKKENELIVHYTETLPENLAATYFVSVNESKRRQTMNNHSATHLLHAALRQVLGKHVEQKGSLVNDKILRFDFSHFAAMTEAELAKVETIVNQKIRENIALNEQRNVPLEKAKSLGAMALFGEKYGEFVRVITFDPKFSVELCGGTHVPFTGNIGLLKIVSESSVAAGVRRIEAVTAEGAQEYLNDNLRLLNEVKSVLKNPKDILASAKSLMEEKHALEKKLEVMYQQQANVLKDELAGKATKSNGCTLISEKVSVPNADSLKNIAYALRNQFDDLLLILAADVDGKPQVAVMLGEKLEATKKYHAGNMVKELAKEIDGGGGGQPFFATAGGKKLEGLDSVLVKAKQLI